MKTRTRTIAIAFLLGMAALRMAASAPDGNGMDEGQRAPDFKLERLEGGTATNHDFHGRLVVVNFWATWCAPCRQELPRLIAAYRRYHEQGLEIVGIAMDDHPGAAVAKFVHDKGINFPVLKGNPSVAAAFGGVRLLPTTFFLDGNGVVIHRTVGAVTEQELAEVLRQQLGTH